MSKNGKLKLGGQTKKSAEVVNQILAACRLGLPLKFCASAGAITSETLRQWRIDDASFNMAVERARGEFVKKRWEDIKKQGIGTKDKPGSWQALCWMLERSHPDAFSRPEIQLSSSVTTNNATLVISVEEAEKIQERSSKVAAEIDALLEQRKKRFETRSPLEGQPEHSVQGKVIDGEAQVIPNEPIVLPPEAERTGSWWRQLSRGDGSRLITKEAARHVIENVVTLVLGALKASGLQIDFDDQPTTLRDVHAAIAELCGGSKGWEMLIGLQTPDHD
jgi:hypothetical protein